MNVRTIAFATITAVASLWVGSIGFSQQQANNTSIDGTIVRAGTDEPVPGALITLTPAPPASAAPILKTTAGLSGQFSFRNIEPGEYQISASGDGYIDSEYRGRGNSAARLEIAEGAHLHDIFIEMVPAGMISGRMHDAAGKPIAGVQVQLLYPVYDGTGTRSFVSKGVGTTNESGEYRIEAVPQGIYYLCSPPVTGRAEQMLRGSTTALSYSISYYPGVTNVSEAATLDIQAGHTLDAVDFQILPRKAYAIRGRLIPSSSGVKADGIMVLMRPEISNALLAVPRKDLSYDTKTSEFEIRDLAPAKYRLEVVEQSNGKAIPDSTAYATVEVTNNDISGLTLRAVAPATVAGHVAVEGADLSNIDRPESLRVGLVTQGRYFLSGKISAQGDFQIEKVIPGDYRVMICYGLSGQACAKSTPGLYLKYAAYAGDNAIDAPLYFTGTESSALDVLLSTHPAQISGIVRTAKDQPAQRAQVVFVPENNRERFDLYKVVVADSAGHFTLSSIAPGVYRVFAWQSIEENAYLNADFIRNAEAYGKRVEVTEDDQAKLELGITPK